MIRAGDVLEGKYKILEKIGQGGMSTVWLAMDTKLNKQWAVKEINKKTVEYSETVNEYRTLTEINIMKRLSHPSLPRIVSVIDEPGTLCVIMDYIEGESLDRILQMYGSQDEENVVAWTLEICDVLSYLHHQDPPIIYRDMKPSNVMLTQEGHIKIIDFGIAREYKTDRNDTLPLGTRGFASPEHFSKHTDVRSDVYTVGVTMYQLLTGHDPSKPPYKIMPIREVNPGLSTGLEKIINKATRLNPDERYQTIQELANAVHSFRQLDDEYIDALEKRIKKHKTRLIASAVTIAVGVSMIAGGNILKSHNYKALLNNSTTMDTEKRAEELNRAIEMSPGNKEAYLELIKVYAKDGLFTENEAEDFLVTYNRNKDSLSKRSDEYAAANYAIGEAFLKFYTGENDNSPRAKLIAAEPYFREACTDDEFDKKTLAEGYVFMAEYYKSYILADNSLVTDDAETEDFNKLLKKLNSIIEELDRYEGEGKDKMTLITYQVITNLLDGQRNEMSGAGIPKEDIANIISKMNRNIGKITSSPDECAKLEKELRQLNSRLKLSYEEKKTEQD